MSKLSSKVSKIIAAMKILAITIKKIFVKKSIHKKCKGANMYFIGDMMETFNQQRYKNETFGYSSIPRNNKCAICSLAYSLTRILRSNFRNNVLGTEELITPRLLNILLKNRQGFVQSTELVIWERLEEIFPIKVYSYLYDRNIQYHFPLELIKRYSVISVDGNMITDEYDSHFISVNDIIYNETKLNQNGQKQIRDINVFDPWEGKNRLLTKKYLKKNGLKNSIFSIIVINRIQQEDT